MLQQIETLLKQHGALTPEMLARELGTSESALAGMISLLQQRGKIERINQSGGCDSGSCCSAGQVTLLRLRKGPELLPVRQQS